MNKKLLLLVITFAIVFFIGNYNQAFSQNSQSPTKKELVKELVGIMNFRETATKELEQTMNQFIVAFQNQGMNNTKLSQEQKEVMSSSMEKLVQIYKLLQDKLDQRINVGELTENIAIELYDKYYTENDIKDFIAFYKSSAGQKSLQTNQKIQQEMMVKVNEKIVPVLSEIISEEIEKIHKQNEVEQIGAKKRKN